VYDYGVLLCCKVIFLHRKGAFYVGCVFPLFPLFPADHELSGDVRGGGKKGLYSWSFDTAYFGRGQLTIQCGFCTYSSVQYLHSQQIGGSYFFWSMYSKSLASGFSFIYSHLFVYLFTSNFSDLCVSFCFWCFIHSRGCSRFG